MKPRNIQTIGLIAAAFTLAACSEKPTKQTARLAAESSDSSLESILLTDEPAEPVHIADLRKQAKVGDQVHFQAKIMGNTTVMVDGRAIMVVGDPKLLTTCDLIHGDSCTTPWDVCCDDQDLVKSSIVTVQIVDSQGSPLKQGLRGVGGMKELSEIIVSGVVAKGSNDQNMLVNASGIFVKK